MKRFLLSLVSVAALLVVSCSTINNGANKLNPTVVGSQTTILVQGAEIALQSKPAFLAEFKVGAQAAGSYLLQIASGSVVLPVTALQGAIQQVLLAKGVSQANASSVSKIAVAEYTLIADQYGFSGAVTIPAKVNTAQVDALLVAIGNALLAA